MTISEQHQPSKPFPSRFLADRTMRSYRSSLSHHYCRRHHPPVAFAFFPRPAKQCFFLQPFPNHPISTTFSLDSWLPTVKIKPQGSSEIGFPLSSFLFHDGTTTTRPSIHPCCCFQSCSSYRSNEGRGSNSFLLLYVLLSIRIEKKSRRSILDAIVVDENR